MRKAAVIAIFAFATAAFGADLTREAKVEKILDLTNAKAMQDQVLGQIKQMAAQQMNSSMPADQRERAAAMQTKMFDLIASRMSWDKMRPMMVKIWGETFNDQELDGILAFYESPAGRAMIQKMPTLMMKSMQQVQALMADLQPEIEKMVKEQIGNRD